MMMESVRNCGTPGSSDGMARLARAFQVWAARTDLGEQINSQNHQLRVNRMPVTRLRESYIVNQRINKQQAGEQKDAVDAMLDGEHESSDRQQGGGQEERVLELLQRLNLRKARQSIPVKDDAAERQVGELFRIPGDPLLGESRLFNGIGEFAHLLILAVEDRVLAGMIHAHPNTFSQRIVAAADLDSDVIAHEDRLVEDHVVAVSYTHLTLPTKR